MRAQVGDELTVKGRHQGDDGHDSLFFPSSDAEITHHVSH